MSTSKPIQITLYHANWCGHCVNFMPIWNKMSSNIKNQKNINFVAYDDKVINNMSNKPNIQGYPTIRIDINGKSEEYKGTRTENDIFKYIINKLKGGNNITTSNTQLSNNNDDNEHSNIPMPNIEGGENISHTATMNDLKTELNNTDSIFLPLLSVESTNNDIYSAPSIATPTNNQKIKYAPRITFNN